MPQRYDATAWCSDAYDITLVLNRRDDGVHGVMSQNETVREQSTQR